jgi:hypothetical protein
MNTIWYEPLVEALHMMEEDALSELKFTEEYLDYSHHHDGDLVTIGCPWSQHCNCDWKSQGRVTFKLEIAKGLDLLL